MPWDNADYYLLSQIRRQESSLDYVLSKLSSLNIVITTGGGINDMEGTANPNEASLVPPYPDKPGSYRMYDALGNFQAVFYWHAATQTWV